MSERKLEGKYETKQASPKLTANSAAVKKTVQQLLTGIKPNSYSAFYLDDLSILYPEILDDHEFLEKLFSAIVEVTLAATLANLENQQNDQRAKAPTEAYKNHIREFIKQQIRNDKQFPPNISKLTSLQASLNEEKDTGEHLPKEGLNVPPHKIIPRLKIALHKFHVQPETAEADAVSSSAAAKWKTNDPALNAEMDQILKSLRSGDFNEGVFNSLAHNYWFFLPAQIRQDYILCLKEALREGYPNYKAKAEAIDSVTTKDYFEDRINDLENPTKKLQALTGKTEEGAHAASNYVSPDNSAPFSDEIPGSNTTSTKQCKQALIDLLTNNSGNYDRKILDLIKNISLLDPEAFNGPYLQEVNNAAILPEDKEAREFAVEYNPFLRNIVLIDQLRQLNAINKDIPDPALSVAVVGLQNGIKHLESATNHLQILQQSKLWFVIPQQAREQYLNTLEHEALDGLKVKYLTQQIKETAQVSDKRLSEFVHLIVSGAPTPKDLNPAENLLFSDLRNDDTVKFLNSCHKSLVETDSKKRQAHQWVVRILNTPDITPRVTNVKKTSSFVNICNSLKQWGSENKKEIIGSLAISTIAASPLIYAAAGGPGSEDIKDGVKYALDKLEEGFAEASTWLGKGFTGDSDLALGVDVGIMLAILVIAYLIYRYNKNPEATAEKVVTENTQQPEPHKTTASENNADPVTPQP